MKLSKENASRQLAIHDAIASGKALGGLIVGFAAAVAGCGERRSPANTMGSFPNPYCQENAANENAEVFSIDGGMPIPEEILAQEQEPSKTNAIREAQGKGLVPGAPPKPHLPAGRYRVKSGDTLTKIAKAYGTTVTELKRLNGFGDARANNLVVYEIIKVPSKK